ncbi:hypothetical protein AQUCO_02100141v1 [Aquilegia coerulea]|uniref:Uncharacterized protein n=1 Tax=Aquilegia coerulea TaxID=218851 RepID=A0A2G5DFT2_AQUCA|nr:hypothetical protein AQUCO_02100141v1 [Aquilegia coerulea]
MDRDYDKEKLSKRSRDERDKDRDSVKDHRDRGRDHKRSSRDGRLRESEERHHTDKYREEKHHRSKDYSQDYDEPKRERSHEPRNMREGSRDERVYREESVEKRSSRDEDRHRTRDYPYDYEEPNRERSHEPRDRREDKRDERVSREESSHKRKQRAESEERLDISEKRRKEEKREKRRFEDKASAEARDMNGTVKEEKMEEWELNDKVKEEQVRDVNGGSNRNGKRERRKFGDRAKEDDMRDAEEEKHRSLDAKSEEKEFIHDSSLKSGMSNSISSSNDVAGLELNMTSNAVSEPSFGSGHPPPTKVSSISTTNENKGVSVTRSHEVPGKSSTDGTTASAAGKSGSLSLDALAKAKKALQMQKELSEKLKKIPLLNKGPSSNSGGTQQMGSNKERSKVPSSSIGTQPLPNTSAFPAKPSASGVPALTGIAAIPNIEAVKRAQELAARMGFHHDPGYGPAINMFPGQMPPDVTVQQKPSKAPVLRLDQYGNEIDEHGNVINMSKPSNLSTLKVNINKQKKEAFQILKPELEVDPELNPHYDERMGINKVKLLRPKRMSIQFVEEGQWSKQAEIIRFKSQFGEAQAKELRTKQAQLAKAKAEPDINPNLIEVSERVITKEKPKDLIPDVEWWDVPLLPSGNYGDVIEGNIREDKLKMEKITIYVEHPLPIEPPAEPAPPPPQPLKLTKKEQKKLRTQRRLAKEKDRQEMIRQGLIEPPKPKVKMSNLMKVLGSEATQDPTRLEMEIRTAAAEREQAHVDRNIARKLTPAERREKKERKLFEDPNTLETIVSVYKINDLSHPQTRFKVDVNAQENRLTGCVVIAEGMSLVVVEGGSKPIKRYGKLMLRRINWATAVVDEADVDENDDRPVNNCVLVWQGSVAKPSFNKFLVHQCRTEAAARKVFSDAGVAHYWDLAVNFTDD